VTGYKEEHLEEVAKRLVARHQSRLVRCEKVRADLLSRLPELARDLRERFGASRVFLIGSLDAPWFQEGSDVDLVIEGIGPRDAVAAERRALDLLRCRVDLLRFEELEPSFRNEVEEEGRLVP